MPQFDLSTFPGQMLWLLIVFALQYLVIALLILPVFKRLFNKRKAYLEQQLQTAEDLSKKAEILRLDYEKKLEDVKGEHSVLLSRALETINSDSEIKLADLEKKFLKEIRKREDKFAKAQEEMGGKIDGAALELAVTLLDRLTPGKVNKKKLIKYMN